MHQHQNFDAQPAIAREKEVNDVTGFLTRPVLFWEVLENLAAARRALKGRIPGNIYPVVSCKNACFRNNEIAGMRIAEGITASHKGGGWDEAEGLAASVSARIAGEIAPFTDRRYLI